ncbi:hypothetical protein [Francisella uliginis]|nr:hypothetical protein [Francisella uliginis]
MFKLSTIFGSNKNNTFIGKQDNNNSSEIETLLDSINDFFYSGNIIKAFEKLDKALKEHTHRKSKHGFLVKKIEFYLELSNIDKAKSLAETINENYSDYSSNKFNECMLVLLSIDNKYEEFNKLIKYLKDEEQVTKSDNYFELIFAVYSSNLEKVKGLFDQLPTKEKEDIFLAANVFLSSYYKNNNLDDLQQAEKYFQLVLENSPKFLNKFHAQQFFVENIINNSLQSFNKFDKKSLTTFLDSLSNIFSAKEHFSEVVINHLINLNAFVLLLLEMKDEYIDFYEKNENVLFDRHYLQYSAIKDIPIDNQRIQTNLSNDNSNKALLINYVSLLLKPEYKNAKDFFENNIGLIIDIDYAIYCYVMSCVNLGSNINDDVLKKIKNDKNESFELFLSYLYIKNHNKDTITKDDVNVLNKFVKNEDIKYIKVVSAIELFEKLNMSTEYINVAISKIDKFDSMSYYVLEKCKNDKSLHINDFENLLEYIDQNQYSDYIGDIYIDYNMYDKAFEYFLKNWKVSKTLKSARLLLSSAYNHFHKFSIRINETVEKEALAFLLAHKKDLEFYFIGTVSSFILCVEKDSNKAIEVINDMILSLNIYNLSHSKKENLCKLYFDLIINNENKYQDIISESNSIYYKDGKYYLDSNIFTKIDSVYYEKFNLEAVNSTRINAIRLNDSYEKKSLFHTITNIIISNIENSRFVKPIQIDLESKNPFSKLLLMLEENSKYKENNLKNHSDGTNISFWNLAGNYDKYLSLIAVLLERPELSFNSCNINYHTKEVKKLLTLSSILFLNYNGKLEDIFKREDVYIQETSYAWLCDYINNLNKQDELLSISTENGKILSSSLGKTQVKQLSEHLKKIIFNIDHSKVVDDTEISLPFKIGNDLASAIGQQELQALALSWKENYQIITEDRIFEVMFEKLRLNLTMVSNSLALINEDNFIDTILELHEKNYRYVINKGVLDVLIALIIIQPITNNLPNTYVHIIKIMDSYGWLDDIRKYYMNVLHGKIEPPPAKYIIRNIEYVIKCIFKNI